jgi:RNA polymerase sigma factor (sigma-70 family)
MRERDSDFERVYDEQLAHVYGFFAYRVKHRQLAEDLTQATFESALRAWPRFDPGRASVRTWLTAIAHNLLVDHHRRSRPRLTGDLDESPLLVESGPEERLIAWPELEDALQLLSEREREILALRFGADLAGPEIAALTGLSLANVQQILSRSLRRLRAVIESADSAPSSGA